MGLTIEMEFSDRFEWRQVPEGADVLPGDVKTLAGYVRRTSLGPGISTTTFRGDGAVGRWQAEREAAELEHKSDHLLIAEHLAAGMPKDNAPGRMTAVRVEGDPKLEAFLRMYFDVQVGEEGGTDGDED